MRNSIDRQNSAAVAVILTVAAALCAGADDAAQLSEQDARGALRKAVQFFRHDVSGHGGYLWRYTADLERREGEGKADTSTGWVQPPGTPTVGMAYLSAYQYTGERCCLDAAEHAADALVKGQLRSGGWTYKIYFDVGRRRKYAYRVDEGDGFNTSTLDDDVTQSALRFLMRLDAELGFENERIHDTVTYGLEHLLEAQYPNGAWPQRFSRPFDPDEFPVIKAHYPESWSRTYPHENYTAYYTFNDNTIIDMIATMFLAAETYGDSRYRDAAIKSGDFILLAQMPDPQPAWAQQYNPEMCPAWARKFEPPAITGNESQGVMRMLLTLYRKTGKQDYLDAVGRALHYFKSSLLPNGQLARFYELKTNKPLYFTKDYELTYEDDDLPTHYGFKSGSSLPVIEKQYKALVDNPPQQTKHGNATERKLPQPPAMSASLTNEARKIVDAMDERGAWGEKGRLRYHGDNDPATEIIQSSTFARNLDTLARFIAAAAAATP